MRKSRNKKRNAGSRKRRSARRTRTTGSNVAQPTWWTIPWTTERDLRTRRKAWTRKSGWTATPMTSRTSRRSCSRSNSRRWRPRKKRNAGSARNWMTTWRKRGWLSLSSKQTLTGNLQTCLLSSHSWISWLLLRKSRVSNCWWAFSPMKMFQIR